MAKPFYTSMAATAYGLIDQFGTDVVVRVEGTAFTDPIEGTVTHTAPVDTTCKGLRTQFSEDYTPGALVEVGDEFWKITSRANPEDILVVAGVERQIIAVWPIDTTGDDFLICTVQTRV